MHKKNTLSQESRDRIISMHLRGSSISRIAEALEKHASTIHNVIRTLQASGRTTPLTRGGDRRSILLPDQKRTIISWVDDDPTITLNQLVIKVYETFQLRIDDNTVDRVLKSFHYTLKRLVPVPERRNSNNTIDIRFNYSERFNEIILSYPDRNIIFLDEVGFQLVSRSSRGRAHKGVTPTISTTATRSRNISVIASATKYGMFDFKINNTPVNGENFREYLVRLKDKCIENNVVNPIFILDNARIHHYVGLENTISEFNLKLVFLPPYSPFLNIIENCFSKWKNYVVRGEASSETELLNLIQEGFNKITETDCEGYFRKMLRNIERCRNREIFDE